MAERTLTKLEQAAIEYFNLEFAESDEPGAGCFCYTDCFNLHPEYPGSSCECLHDVVEWYQAAQQGDTADQKPLCAFCDDDFYSCEHCGRGESGRRS